MGHVRLAKDRMNGSSYHRYTGGTATPSPYAGFSGHCPTIASTGNLPHRQSPILLSYPRPVTSENGRPCEGPAASRHEVPQGYQGFNIVPLQFDESIQALLQFHFHLLCMQGGCRRHQPDRVIFLEQGPKLSREIGVIESRPAKLGLPGSARVPLCHTPLVPS